MKDFHLTLNFYSGAGLDRSDEKRGDAAWLAERLADPQSAFLPVWRTRNLIADEIDPRALWLSRAEAAPLIARAAEVIFLGLDGVTACFALDLSSLDEAEAVALVGGRFVDLRSVGALLSRVEGSRLAYARALAYWHERHRFCGLCGSPTVSQAAGHQRRCSNTACAALQFPRTDPAVIMLLTDGTRCLLGRQAVWPAGMRSTLAGFVEPGESLEEAVKREVMEEVGLEVEAIAYHSSQPWPFPASLMVGFWARVPAQEPRINRTELEDARWFTRAELEASPENERLRLPRRDSIARRLIADWLTEG